MNLPLMMPLTLISLAPGKGDPEGNGTGAALLGGGTPGDAVLRERHHVSLANGSSLEATYSGSYDGNANLFKETMTMTGPELLVARVLGGLPRPSRRPAAPHPRRHSAACMESDSHEADSLHDASDIAMSEGGDTDEPEADLSSSCSSWPRGISPSPSPEDRWWARGEGGGQDWAWVEARWQGLRHLRTHIPPALEERLRRVRVRGWGRGLLRGLQERVRGLQRGLGGAWRGASPRRAPRDPMCRSCSLTLSSEDDPREQSTSQGRFPSIRHTGGCRDSPRVPPDNRCEGCGGEGHGTHLYAKQVMEGGNG
ncbi:hypothetical protein O3P69_020249 [Scylla paramamosain]|uniref:Uncharacterized protein n=1 Tax=Scylla paramamosain TaxID=85552 RepID=A0AAW0TLS6_SCYPA